MKFKTGILLFLFILTTCSTGLAAENTHAFPDVGTLTFPAEVEVIPYQEGSKVVHDLITKDDEIWRTARFFFSRPFTGVHRKDLKDNINIIDAALSEVSYRQLREVPTARLLLNTPTDASTFSDEKLIIKTSILYNRWALHADYYAIDCPEGIRVLVVLSSDGDVHFWRPIIANVIANIQK